MNSIAPDSSMELTTMLDFEAEELQKRLKYSMANFAQLKFIKMVQTRVIQNIAY